MIVAGLIDGALDGSVEKALDGWVEAIEWRQCADLCTPQLFGRALKCVQDRTLTLGEMQTCGASLADGLKDLLDQGELISGEGIAGGKIGGICVGPKGHARVHKRKLVLQNVLLAGVRRGQRCRGGIVLLEEAFLDNFIHVGAGEGKPCLEAALDFRKVLGLGAFQITQHCVQVFLGGHDNPGPAMTDCAKLFGDGLQVEHEVGVAADELADLICQEHDAVLWALAVQITLDPFGKIFHGKAEIIFRSIDPLLHRAFALSQGLGERSDDFVPMKFPGVSLLYPRLTGHPLKRRMENPKPPLLVKMAFHMGNVGVVAAIALLLV